MAHRSRRRQADVAHFARQIVRAVIKASIRDDPRAEPCSHGQEDHILGPLPRAKSVLRHRSGVGVILHLALRAEFLLHDCLDWNVIPGGKIGRRLDNRPGFDPRGRRN